MEFSADRDDKPINEEKPFDITFDGNPNYEKRFLQKSKFPGCFKKTVAFLVDNIIIVLIGVILLFPFSNYISSLYQHGWIPGYLIGAIYFTILDSYIINSQSIGKKLFGFTVTSIDNKSVSPFVAMVRYIMITIPFYNILISGSIATTIGLTNTAIGGIIYLIVIGLLLSGNTLFMFFHPQKRGLHDVLTKSMVVHANSNEPADIRSFCFKPLLSGAIGFIIFTIAFGSLMVNVSKNPDFSDIVDLSERIKKESHIKNINATYRTFAMNGKQTSFAIEVDVPIPYDKIEDKKYTDELSSKLYPLVKSVNRNPKVDTITIIFQSQKYFGALPIYKAGRFPKNISEIN